MSGYDHDYCQKLVGYNLSTKKTETNESQYGDLIDRYKNQSRETFGLIYNFAWKYDPRRVLFTFARYKFVSRMFEGFGHVLEVGCGDAFATRLVQQTVKKVTVTDFDPLFIAEIEERQQPNWHLDARVHNMLSGPLNESFEGAYSLDVLEHIESSDEDLFIQNICKSISLHGTLIIGMPSIESQVYASEGSKIGHVNCKTGSDLRDLMKKYFHSVFMFSMNDEVVHTGFFPMAHYLIAVCCDKK